MSDATSRRVYYLTPAGRVRLRHRIHEARLAHEAICASNGEAAEAGDSSVWHDNFAYEENQRQMHQLARRVRTLEEILTSAAEVCSRPGAPARAGLDRRGGPDPPTGRRSGTHLVHRRVGGWRSRRRAPLVHRSALCQRAHRRRGR